jgi:orotate phosphoribosyltransferase
VRLPETPYETIAAAVQFARSWLSVPSIRPDDTQSLTVCKQNVGHAEPRLVVEKNRMYAVNPDYVPLALEQLDEYGSQRSKLKTLLQTYAYREGKITLSSGKESDWYIDCKQVALMGAGHVHIGAALSLVLDVLPYRACAVAGLTLGADPLVSAVSLWSTLRGTQMHGMLVRKEPKNHGTGSQLEGPVSRLRDMNMPVVVLEDVVTTAKASLTAIAALRKEGFIVNTVLALVDRGDVGRANLAFEGVELHALFGESDFRS